MTVWAVRFRERGDRYETEVDVSKIDRERNGKVDRSFKRFSPVRFAEDGDRVTADDFLCDLFGCHFCFWR